jgi:hypothetical protein
MSEQLDRPEVSEMVAVHRVFRDTLGCAPALIGEIGSSDTDRAAVIGNFYENVLAFLHAHHEGEEEVVFPPLRDRCPDRLELIERVAAQHHDIIGAMSESRAALASWSAGESGAGERAATALDSLGAEAAVHFDDEEKDLLPLCADHLSVPEWNELPTHGMRSFEGDKIWLILGLIRQRLSPAQRDAMLTRMPPPAVEMWTGFGESAFNGLIAEVGAPLG